MRYPTGSSNRAAALLSQKEFPTAYVGLEPTRSPNTFKFVIDCDVAKEELDIWLAKYNNQKALVEPIQYDTKFKMLIQQSREQQT